LFRKVGKDFYKKDGIEINGFLNFSYS